MRVTCLIASLQSFFVIPLLTTAEKLFHLSSPVQSFFRLPFPQSCNLYSSSPFQLHHSTTAILLPLNPFSHRRDIITHNAYAYRISHINSLSMRWTQLCVYWTCAYLANSRIPGQHNKIEDNFVAPLKHNDLSGFFWFEHFACFLLLSLYSSTSQK